MIKKALYSRENQDIDRHKIVDRNFTVDESIKFYEEFLDTKIIITYLQDKPTIIKKTNTIFEGKLTLDQLIRIANILEENKKE